MQVGAPGAGQWVKEALGKDEKAEAAARKVLNYHKIPLSLWVKLIRTYEHRNRDPNFDEIWTKGTLGSPNRDPNRGFMKFNT